MDLTFHGHACLSLRAAGGFTVVTDPYRPGAFGGKIGHAPLRTAADVVTVSHYHVDHSHVTPDLAAPDGSMPEVVDHTSTARGLDVTVAFTYHDRAGGTRMGMNGMVAFTLDGLRVAHLGDLGRPVTAEEARALGPVDVLLFPAGGVYTLGPEDALALLASLRPRLAVPIHYENDRCRLGLAPVEALLARDLGPYAVARPGASSWSSAGGLPDEPTVLVLEPAL